MLSDISAYSAGPENWEDSPRSTHLMKHPDNNYLRLSITDLPNLHVQYAFSINAHTSMKATQATLGAFTHAKIMDPVSAPLHFVSPTNTRTASLPSTSVQTRFDSSFDSSPRASTDRYMHSATSSSFTPWKKNVVQDSILQRRRHSAMADVINTSPTVPVRKIGRRCKSEQAEKGSARAVYLEKNRKAAMKCRDKQKMQHEELVEAARNFERKNKVLKAEVELLKFDITGLLHIAGEHTNCVDDGLQSYTQHAVDRMVMGNRNNIKQDCRVSLI